MYATGRDIVYGVTTSVTDELTYDVTHGVTDVELISIGAVGRMH